MIKPASLREAVKRAVKALQDDPAKLLVFVDEGRVLSHGPGSLSFEYSYTLNLIVTDMAGSADEVMVAVLDWAQVNQPDLLVVNEKRRTISFEVDQVSHDTYDLSLKMPLTEAVEVTKGDGRPAIRHVTEKPQDWMM